MKNLTPIILESNIYYYKNAIDNPAFVVEAIESTDSLVTDKDIIGSWYNWGASDSKWSFGKRKDINPDNYSNSTFELQKSYDILKYAVDSVTAHHSGVLGKRLEFQPPRTINKYETGRFMGPHTDANSGAFLSAVVYLNDNYGGGEIEFINQGISLKPEAGSILVFPSVEPYVHDPKEITSGEKYISTMFWFNS